MNNRRNSPSAKIVDIEEHNGYFRTITSSFDRKYIDDYRLKEGIYNVYAKTVDQSEYRCEENLCNDELLVLETRIIAAVDIDDKVYTLTDLQPEQPELTEILFNTNKRVVLCMKHKATVAFVLGDQEKIESAKIIPFMNAVNNKPRRPPKKVR